MFSIEGALDTMTSNTRRVTEGVAFVANKGSIEDLSPYERLCLYIYAAYIFHFNLSLSIPFSSYSS